MPEVVIRIRQFRDLRTLHLRQAYERAVSLAEIARYDEAIERRWREHVKANIARRRLRRQLLEKRQHGQLPALLRRQAE